MNKAGGERNRMGEADLFRRHDEWNEKG